MKNRWVKLGGVLGIIYCIAGFVLIFLGWNGAASNNSVAAQIPYVVSGGLAGLGLVVVGSALMVANSLRNDRVELRGAIDDLRASIERGAAVAPSAVGSTAGVAGSAGRARSAGVAASGGATGSAGAP